MNIVFMGTPDFAVESLKRLYENGHNILAVVSQPDRKSGRGMNVVPTPVKEYAESKGLKVYQPERIRKDKELIEKIRNMKPDVIVVVAFGQILPKEVLDIPKYETINLHASLLPKYRGANPIQRAIINGDKETGICTMITELGLDCGDVCQKLVIPISDTMNCEELWNEIGEKSPKMIEETLIGLKNKTLTPVKQCEEGVCMANKLTKEECEIDWCKSNIQIHNLVRGVCRCPSAFFYYNDKLIKVIETTPVDEEIPTGIVRINSKDGIDVGCGIGAIRLLKVKPEGKGEMPARDWFNGVKKG